MGQPPSALHSCRVMLGRPSQWRIEKVVGLTGFVIIHVFIASFSPAQGEHNQMVNTKFTRPVNEMPMSSLNIKLEEITFMSSLRLR